MKRKVRFALAVLILVGTIGLFINYVRTHPALVDKLGDIRPSVIGILIVLYLVWFAALVVILRLSMRLYGKTMSRQENILLNAYSTLINFFGPGQSGPALRGLYLKKRHGLGIKKYLFATLLYYGFYAIISAFLLCVGSRPWWQTALLMAAAAGGSAVVIRWYAKRSKIKNEAGINLANLGWLFAATVVQLATQTVIFYLELREVEAGVSVAQALTYTGAANFALFVALTPGAIGIREAFLIFSQSLHHLSSGIIVAANVIDRAVYLLFLGLLFIMVVSLHAKDKLRITHYTSSTNKEQG